MSLQVIYEIDAVIIQVSCICYCVKCYYWAAAAVKKHKNENGTLYKQTRTCNNNKTTIYMNKSPTS